MAYENLICADAASVHLKDKAHLIVSSPPYGIGKKYESFKTIAEYEKWADIVVESLKANLTPQGSVCWQVGTYTDSGGEYIPLDVLYIPIFRKHGFLLKNRVVWKFGSGLHSTKRLSGRYEVMLWFVLDGSSYTFNLDEIRIPSLYPGKRAYKGPNKGKISGNPLGKNPSDVWVIMAEEWEQSMWDFPNVKSNHPEKIKAHPCQFPIELAERCVLAFSNEGDTVFDPFAGTGSTGCAAVFHRRNFVGVDNNSEYLSIARERIESARKGTLKHRAIGTPILRSSDDSKTRKIPEEWKETIKQQSKKSRLYAQNAYLAYAFEQQEVD